MEAVNWYRWVKKISIALIPVSGNAIALLLSATAVAQIIPDHTFGSEQSVLHQNVLINNQTGDLIEGGARRGANLFHSFEQFNVNDGQRLYFANPIGVVNIIGRVTGDTGSHILGTLGVEGTANLFLLNPNGIVFGENATLDVRGSFVATTANRLQFGTQGFFGTDNPQAPPLLTINPSALVFNHLLNHNPSGGIQTQSVADAGSSLIGDPLFGLRVADGQNLLLVGGNLAIAGGLNALGGQLGLIAVKAPATVELSADAHPAVQQLSSVDRANLLIDQNALLNVMADGGGSIQIEARDIQIQGNSLLQAGIDQGLGTKDSQAGNIILNATGAVDVSGSTIQNGLLGQGKSGDLVIRGRSLTLDQGATLAAFTQSQGDAGRVTIHITGPVVFTENATIFNTIDQAEPQAVGTTGGVFLEAGTLTIKAGAELIANTNGIGNVGDVVVRVRGDARLTGSNDQGDPSGILNVVRPGGVGNSGDIRFSARSLSITNGARLQTNTRGQGNAGDVRLRVRDRLLLDSKVAIAQDSTGVFTAVGTDGVGRGGDIDIRAGDLTVLNGAQLSATTFEHGNAGNITIQVRGQATFDGTNITRRTGEDTVARSGVLSIVGEDVPGGTIPAIGNGGNIHISANQVALLNGAVFATSVTSNSQGNAGRITIEATDRVLVDGQDNRGDGSSVTAEVDPGAIGNASNIRITTDRLTISHDGVLQANIGGVGEAGNIEIHSRLLDLLSGGQLLTTTAGNRPAGDIRLRVGDRLTISGQNSGLFANTKAGATGRGGSINVTARQLALSDRAQVTVSNPTGRAGNLTIAANQVSLNQSSLTAEAGAGSGAEIILRDLDSLLLQHNSLISARASANATGGNITVSALDGFVLAAPDQNSDIIASAAQGRGGNISITAQGVFELDQQRSQPPNQTNDIDASSQFSQSGTVTITQPNVDPSRGLVVLPANLVDRSNQIARGCPSRNSGSNRFVVTGRGGLPLSPDQLLRDRTIVAPDWVTLGSETGDRPAIALQRQEHQPLEQINAAENPIVEADGFGRNNNGEIVLVAQSQLNDMIHELISDRCLK